MATFLTCSECKEDRLVSEAFVAYLLDAEEPLEEFVCDRCEAIYPNEKALFEMECEAYRRARLAEV